MQRTQKGREAWEERKRKRKEIFEKARATRRRISGAYIIDFSGRRGRSRKKRPQEAENTSEAQKERADEFLAKLQQRVLEMRDWMKLMHTNRNEVKVNTQKKRLRKQMATLLESISEDEVQRESSIVFHKIIDSGLLKNVTTVSVYASTRGEICTDNLIMHCLAVGKCVYIPRFKKGVKQMDMLRLQSLNEFQMLDQTLWGIRQHSPGAEIIPFEEDAPCFGRGLDLVFMPGVAFTRNGRRLGHGMGFYDEFLHEHRRRFIRTPKTVALALTVQMVDEVPTTTERDVIVDCVLHA